MCARYEFLADCPELHAILEALRRRRPGAAWHPGTVYPSASAPVLLEAAGELVPELLCWGFPWPGRRPVINARAETLLERPMFREPARSRRCAVPASSFFEWDSQKHQFVLRRADGRPLYLAGVYDRRDGLDCYCVVTRPAQGAAAEIHDRMPLILSQEAAEAWVLDGGATEDLLRTEPPPLEAGRTDGQLRLW